MRRAALAVLHTFCVPLLLFGQHRSEGGSSSGSSNSSSSSGGYSGGSSGGYSGASSGSYHSSSSSSSSSSSGSGSSHSSSSSGNSGGSSSGSSSRGSSGGSHSSSGSSPSSRSGTGSHSGSGSSAPRSNIRTADSDFPRQNVRTGDVDHYPRSVNSDRIAERQSSVKERNWFARFLLGKRDPSPDLQSSITKPCRGENCKPGPPPCQGKNCKPAPGPPPPIVSPGPPRLGTPAIDPACSDGPNVLVAGHVVRCDNVYLERCGYLRRQLEEAEARLSAAEPDRGSACADPQRSECASAASFSQHEASVAAGVRRQYETCLMGGLP